MQVYVFDWLTHTAMFPLTLYQPRHTTDETAQNAAMSKQKQLIACTFVKETLHNSIVSMFYATIYYEYITQLLPHSCPPEGAAPD